MRPAHRFPTVVIAIVLLSQIAVTATGVAVKLAGSGYWEDNLWPFMDYPMYSAAHGPPVQTSSATLAAEMPDGTEIDVTAEFMGLLYFAWRYHIVERLDVGEIEDRHAHLAEQIHRHRDEALWRVVQQVRERTGVTPIAVRVDRRTHTIADGGLVIDDTQQRLVVPADLSTSLDPNAFSP